MPLCQTAREAVSGLVAFLSARGSPRPRAPRSWWCGSIRLGQQIFQQLHERAGREVPATPHSTRHYAAQLVERTQDLVATSRHNEYRSLQTTDIYTRVRPGELLGQLRRYHPRGRRRGPPLERVPRKQCSG